MTSDVRRSLRVICFGILVAGICSLGLIWGTTSSRSSASQDQNSFSAKIAPQVLADTANGKSASVLILMADQADVSAAHGIKDQDARGWFVYNTLTQHSARTQADLQRFLKSRAVAYQSFWVVNMIVASADSALVGAIAARSDVARIDSNKAARWIEDPVIANVHETASKPNAPTTAEWGVTNVNAPAVWALGFTGAGMIVANEDTGMRWTHNALKPKYRGWNGSVADHNFNWHDSIHTGGGVCGANTVAPCDDQGHGTHTTGTMTGDDGTGNQVGVAPGAKWIGCRNMDQGNGTPATYSECFQFFIAPTDLAGNNPNPALRPHVINNSWGCPVSEGCVTRAELETIINNTEAAGIFVEASAGNSGPGCSSVSDPPSIYSASFSTGAIDISNNLASFSSRGPSTFYTPNLLKPNISAPGVNVRSTTRTSDTSFGNMSGTSMAGPHVAAVVALLWSARPQLIRNIAATKSLLQSTANPSVTVALQTCGGTPSTQIPNNSFGYGRVDALAAVNAAPTAGPGTITGTITSQDGSALSGVSIKLNGPQSRKTITDSNGTYRFDNVDANGVYTLTPSRLNYTFNPTERSFNQVGQHTEALFSGLYDGGTASPLDATEYFVRQQYLDFLNREPDEAGFNFWVNNIESCGGDLACRAVKRDDTSAAFFLSIEFRETGYLVHRMYQAAFGDPVDAPIPLNFVEFTNDRQIVGDGVIVTQPGWPDTLAHNKEVYGNLFVQRSRFASAYSTSLTPEEFVDRLFANAGVVPGPNDRALAIGEFGLTTNTSDQAARARALRRVAESPQLIQQEFNQAFVEMQYFGYLHRTPNTDPDSDYSGYQFWLTKLNSFGGNYRDAEMVRAFLLSIEYRQRFPR